jgi:hypothetical protein
VPVLIIVGGPSLMWLRVRHVEDIQTKRWAIGLALTMAIALAALARPALERWRDKPAAEPPGSSAEMRERWRAALQDAVIALRVNSSARANGGKAERAAQLEQMLREGRGAHCLLPAQQPRRRLSEVLRRPAPRTS